jgi:hypothetical protein
MQYRTGTVKIISGEATVEGIGTSWNTEVDPADLFKVKDENVIYQVGSVTDATHLELSAPYVGTTRSGELYQVTRDFTPNFLFPEVSAGDIDWPANMTKALRMIDTVLNAISGEFSNYVHV